MTEKEQQIKEIAKDLSFSICWCCDEVDSPTVDCLETAAQLYISGYRKQVQGKWEEHTGENWYWPERCEKYTYYVCSECGKEQMRESPYCPNCGKIMRGCESDA